MPKARCRVRRSGQMMHASALRSGAARAIRGLRHDKRELELSAAGMLGDECQRSDVPSMRGRKSRIVAIGTAPFLRAFNTIVPPPDRLQPAAWRYSDKGPSRVPPHSAARRMRLSRRTRAWSAGSVSRPPASEWSRRERRASAPRSSRRWRPSSPPQWRSPSRSGGHCSPSRPGSYSPSNASTPQSNTRSIGCTPIFTRKSATPRMRRLARC